MKFNLSKSNYPYICANCTIDKPMGKKIESSKKDDPHMMDRICAWCKKRIGQKKGDKPLNEDGEMPVETHGICEDCLKLLENEMDLLTKQNKG